MGSLIFNILLAFGCCVYQKNDITCKSHSSSCVRWVLENKHLTCQGFNTAELLEGILTHFLGNKIICFRAESVYA